jgi:hypothetical protein
MQIYEVLSPLQFKSTRFFEKTGLIVGGCNFHCLGNNMKRRSLLYCGISLAVFAASSFVPVSAQSRTGVTQRVQFERGRFSTMIKGSVQPGNKDTYIFRVRQGQEIIVDVVWDGTPADENEEQGLSGFTFIQPDGNSFENPQDGYFNAASTGDYRAIIAQPYRLSSPGYTFKLTIR